MSASASVPSAAAASSSDLEIAEKADSQKAAEASGARQEVEEEAPQQAATSARARGRSQVHEA